MTTRLYLADSHLKECRARVLSLEDAEGGFDAVLDRTVFFPNAGGQPCDTGTLRFAGGTAAVTGADERGGDVVHHLSHAVPPGTEVEAQIDWARRFDHMQQHTGEHLLSYAAYTLFDAVNVGFHLSGQYGTIDLDRPLDAAQLGAIERHANELLCRDLPVTAACFDSEEALARAGLPLRKHAEGLTAPIRIVSIEGADCCTCCAPHCARTGEIGQIFLADAIPWKGGVRVTFLCGLRALDHARRTHDALDAIARRFSTGRESAPAAVQKQFDDMAALRRRERALAARCNEYLAAELRAGAEPAGRAALVARLVDAPGDRLRELAAQALCGSMLMLLLASDGARVQYVLRRSDDLPLDMGELCQAVNAALGGKGGGRGALAQGSAPAQAALDETLAQLRAYLMQRLRALK